jgi:hypothetical protein
MNFPPFEAGNAPTLSPDESAWIYDHGKLSEEKVFGAIMEWRHTDNGDRMFCTGYRLSWYNLSERDLRWRPNEVWATEELAAEKSIKAGLCDKAESAPPLNEKSYVPPLRPGDRAWVIVGKSVQEITVQSLVFQTVCSCTEISGPSMIFTGYLADVQDESARDYSFKPHGLYSSRDEAEAAARWYPIELTREEWLRAIGDRDDGDTVDCSELPMCCANVSAIRDLLTEAWAAGGLNARDRTNLEHLLVITYGCGPYPGQEDKPPVIFNRLLEQLGLDKPTERSLEKYYEEER